MCARYTLTRRLNLLVQEMAELLLDEGALYDWDPPPRYNIAPTQQVAAVRASADSNRHELVPLKWGLIPFWSKTGTMEYSTLNAKAETVAKLASYREPFKRRRCLVLADGYYEWTGKRGKKQPWHFHLAGGQPFAFAGLWDCWRPPEGEPVETCTIVTTVANELAAKYHDRMPVILDPADYARWLDPTAQPDGLLPLMESRPVQGLTVTAANPVVNSPRNDSPECLRAAAAG